MATVALTDVAVSAANGTNYTWSTGTADAIEIGPYAEDQYLIAISMASADPAAGAPTGLTMDAQASSPLAAALVVNTRAMRGFILSRENLPDPEEENFDAGLALSAAQLRAAVVMFVATGIDPTVFDYAPASFSGSGTPTLTHNGTLPSGHSGVNCAAGGILVGAGMGNVAGGGTTLGWTGSETVQGTGTTFENSSTRGVYISDGTEELGRTIQCVYSSTSDATGIIFTFQAAASGLSEPASRRKQGMRGGLTGGMQASRRPSGLYVPERRVIVPGWRMPKRQPMRMEMR